MSQTKHVMSMDHHQSNIKVTVINRSELDLHADTCCAGPNTIYSKETVNILPFSEEYKPMKDIPIALVVTIYNDPCNGLAIFLVIHKALCFGDGTKQTLLCPNQMRTNGLKVHDTPRQFDKQFDKQSAHSIEFPTHDLKLPLSMEGVISYLPT
jgi:hypothetical protein